MEQRLTTSLCLAGTVVLLAALVGLPLHLTHQPASAQSDATATPAPTETAIPTETPTATPTPTPTNAAPTLVPPTLLPQQATPLPTPTAAVSGLAGVQSTKTLRVGTYYNAYPFTWLDEQGQVVGYEADILRAIGVELGVDVEFVQVTRHNALDTLLSGDVDALIGQQIHTRDRESIVDFTHPYYLNAERMVVRQDSSYTELPQMAGQPIGVEIGSRSEQALRHWCAQTGITFDIRTYLSEDKALDALAAGEVQGMVGPLDSLRRAGRQQMRLIDQPILEEPYAITVRRWDINLLNLLNRSLQRLKASGRLDEIFAAWFPGETMDFNTLVPVYDTLYDDQRGLDQFNNDMPYPATSVVARIQSGQPVRVAGLLSPGEDAPAQVRIIDALNRAMIEEMARRWNATLDYVPNSALNAVDLVANGQADIAVGASARWDGADRVDYSLPYIQHGDRLMIPAGSGLSGFSDMLGSGWIIGYFADDAADAEHIQKFADYFNVGQNVRTFAIQRENEAIYIMITESNIKAIFGDSLRLLALTKEGDSGSSVKILNTWYGDVLPITFAVPRNDADFQEMVDHTLQDMARDGTYSNLWAAFFGLGDPLKIPFWPDISPDVP